jgi:hypothetical protein
MQQFQGFIGMVFLAAIANETMGLLAPANIAGEKLEPLPLWRRLRNASDTGLFCCG